VPNAAVSPAADRATGGGEARRQVQWLVMRLARNREYEALVAL